MFSLNYPTARKFYGNKIYSFPLNCLDEKLMDFNFTKAHFPDQYVIEICDRAYENRPVSANYIFANISHSECSILFSRTSEESPLNSEVVI